MRPGAGDKLYFSLERTYRRRATSAQFLLALLALALSLGAMALHYSQVFRPWQEADFAQATMAYQPWYLVQEEALPLPQVMRSEEPGETPGGQGAVVKATLRPQNTNFARPNLVPETGVTYSLSQVEERVAAYLKARGQVEQSRTPRPRPEIWRRPMRRPGPLDCGPSRFPLS